MSYAAAMERQTRAHEELLARRSAPAPGTPRTVLLDEHDPGITMTRRTDPGNIIASSAALAAAGVEVARTDRGGDVTYHGPGQLVVYPIVDLPALGLSLHAYMRLLEQVVIETIAQWGVHGQRDPGATGVWVAPEPGAPLAKIAAMGVRIRRWITLHGLALNVDPELGHFQLIVPCGLAGRPVTSLRALLGPGAPSMADARCAITAALQERLRPSPAS
jgi:lipoyl(octanoyl) transferase